jgi:hypothetical protein
MKPSILVYTYHVSEELQTSIFRIVSVWNNLKMVTERSKLRYLCNVHGVTYQKTVIFKNRCW